MPAYEYTCRECKKDFTVFLSLKEVEENLKVICPDCGSENVYKIYTGFFAKTSKKS